MLASLTQLLKSLKEDDSKIFDKEMNHDVVKDTLAVLMIHVMLADDKITEKENENILGFFQNEFNMSASQTRELFNSIVDNIGEFDMYLETLNKMLVKDISTKAKIMQHLNNLIICDGCLDVEYHVFEKIKSSLI